MIARITKAIKAAQARRRLADDVRVRKMLVGNQYAKKRKAALKATRG